MELADLAEQLRAALGEHERIARAAIQGPWHTSEADHLSPYVVYGVSPIRDDRIVQVCNIETAWQRHENAAFMAANGPDVALRTVQAHREILARYESAVVARDAAAGTLLAGATRMALRIHGEALRSVAAIYLPDAT